MLPAHLGDVEKGAGAPGFAFPRRSMGTIELK